MTSHTPTSEILEALNGKRSILAWWQLQPIESQAREKPYIDELTRKVRRLQTYLEHRKDSPI